MHKSQCASYLSQSSALRLVKLTYCLATDTFNPFPKFAFAGPLRPVYPLSSHRTVPKSIPHPVWWEDGDPKYQRSIINRNKFDILDKKGQDAMRKACKLGREVLDIAAAAAKPGVTTDQIDEIVHQACVDRNVSICPCSVDLLDVDD